MGEEPGVVLGLAPELCDRAEVGPGGDQRDPNPLAALLRSLKERAELRLLFGGNAGILGEEQGLRHEDVAGGVAVRER